MTSPSIVIVGASNLVTFKRQPLVACNCPTVCVAKENHVTGISPDVTFEVIAKPGAKFGHNNPEKDAFNLIEEAMSKSPETIVIYMDLIMNTLTVPPWLSNSDFTPQKK